MRALMINRTILAILAALPCAAWGQATPTATVQPFTNGLNLPAITGNFQYGLSASEVIQKGYSSNGNVNAQTNLSGDLAYASKSVVHPTSLLYTGGIQFGANAGNANTYFQSLAISQAYVTRKWVFGVSDQLSYLPQSPTVGLSGIPGTGDIGLIPIQTGTDPAQNILTINNNRLSNAIDGTVERQLDAFTSVSGGASYGILHFFGNGGLDSTQIGADVAVNRRIDARSSASLAATYGTFNYSNLGVGASFNTRGISASYQRQISRALNASVSGGPEWISASSSLGIPSRLTFSAGAGLNYTVRVYRAGVNYSRAVNAGAGVQPGGISDSVVASLERPFGAAWSASANVGYSRTQGLANGATPLNLALLGITSTGNYNSTFAGLQVSRRITRSFSGFASYTVLNQGYSQTRISPTALNGFVQSFAIGISYFPRSLHLGQL